MNKNKINSRKKISLRFSKFRNNLNYKKNKKIEIDIKIKI